MLNSLYASMLRLNLLSWTYNSKGSIKFFFIWIQNIIFPPIEIHLVVTYSQWRISIFTSKFHIFKWLRKKEWNFTPSDDAVLKMVTLKRKREFSFWTNRKCCFQNYLNLFKCKWEKNYNRFYSSETNNLLRVCIFKH